MTGNSRGFTLIELLIVVAIILTIAGIAIPNLLRSRIAANQASAVGTLRTLNTAEITYLSTYNVGYSSMLSYLGPTASGAAPTSTLAGLVDSLLAGSGSNVSTKSGYSFGYTPGTAVNNQIYTYQIVAKPVTVGTTGTNYYYTDHSGVLRQNSTATAGSTDSPVGG